MSTIQPIQVVAYFAPTARRRFLTKRGAATAEARSRIKKKYPSERSDYAANEPGWSWLDLPHHEKLLKRYSNILFRSIPKPTP